MGALEGIGSLQALPNASRQSIEKGQPMQVLRLLLLQLSVLPAPARHVRKLPICSPYMEACQVQGISSETWRRGWMGVREAVAHSRLRANHADRQAPVRNARRPATCLI